MTVCEAGSAAAAAHAARDARALKSAISMHAMTASTRGVCLSLMVSGNKRRALCAWNTKMKKPRKWSKISAKKYHHRPMLGDKSSTCCAAWRCEPQFTQPCHGRPPRGTHQHKPICAFQPISIIHSSTSRPGHGPGSQQSRPHEAPAHKPSQRGCYWRSASEQQAHRNRLRRKPWHQRRGCEEWQPKAQLGSHQHDRVERQVCCARKTQRSPRPATLHRGTQC